MIVNLEKCKAMISCDKKENKYTLNIEDSPTSEEIVILFGVEIDN